MVGANHYLGPYKSESIQPHKWEQCQVGLPKIGAIEKSKAPANTKKDVSRYSKCRDVQYYKKNFKIFIAHND